MKSSPCYKMDELWKHYAKYKKLGEEDWKDWKDVSIFKNIPYMPWHFCADQMTTLKSCII